MAQKYWLLPMLVASVLMAYEGCYVGLWGLQKCDYQWKKWLLWLKERALYESKSLPGYVLVSVPYGIWAYYKMTSATGYVLFTLTTVLFLMIFLARADWKQREVPLRSNGMFWYCLVICTGCMGLYVAYILTVPVLTYPLYIVISNLTGIGFALVAGVCCIPVLVYRNGKDRKRMKELYSLCKKQIVLCGHGIFSLGEVLQGILEIKMHGVYVKDNADELAWVKEAILSFEPLSEYVIWETEPDRPGKVERLRQIADVDLCICTGVCPVKPEKFRTQDQNITQGKEAARLCKEDGVAVVYLDNEVGKETYTCKTVTYSFEDMADYRILDFHTGIHGSTFLLASKNESMAFTTTWCGKQMMIQLAGLIVGAHVLGISLEQLQAIVSRLPQKTGCNSVTEYEGRMLLDQSRLSYYDHISSAKDILNQAEGTLVVITCGIREQDEENYSLGRQLAGMTDCVVAIGKIEGEALEEGLLDGNPDAVCYIVNNEEQAMQKALSLTKQNDVIWVERRG